MKKKIIITEHEWNDPAGGWEKWKVWNMQEVKISGKNTWVWIVGDAIVTKWEHDFEKKIYEIEYFEKQNAGLSELVDEAASKAVAL